MSDSKVQELLHAVRKLSVDGVERETVLRAAESRVKWDKYIGAGKGSSSNLQQQQQQASGRTTKEENLFVTAEDVERIREYEGLDDAAVQELVETQPRSAYGFAAALMKVMRNITDELVLQYALTLIEDFLAPNMEKRCKFFKPEDAGPETQEFDLSPFLRALEHEDKFIREKACFICALFLSIQPSPRESLDAYFTWVCEQLRSGKNCVDSALAQYALDQKNSARSMAGISPRSPSAPPTDTAGSAVGRALHDQSLKAAICSLQFGLRTQKARQVFHSHQGLKLLFPLLPLVSFNVQLLYDTAYAIWVATFCAEAAEEYTPPMFEALVSVIRNKPRTKVIRVCVATLRAVLRSQPGKEQEISECLISLDLIAMLENLENSRIEDKDLADDVKWLKDILVKNYRVLTTYESYAQELNTGKLRPGSIHDERFWRENAKRFEVQDFAAIRQLGEILVTSTDNETLALACSDIGFFVQYYPNGKTVAASTGVKSKVMALIAHSDIEVQRNALLAISKMLVQNWSFLKQKE